VILDCPQSQTWLGSVIADGLEGHQGFNNVGQPSGGCTMTVGGQVIIARGELKMT